MEGITWMTGTRFSRNRVERTDKRDPMTRLLEDGLMKDGLVVVSYDQQWKTLTAAKKYGYVDEDHKITDKGLAYVAKRKARLAS